MEPFGRLETLVPRIRMQGSNGDLSLRRYPQLSPVLSERLGDEKWAICSGPQGPFEWVVWHQVTGEHLRRIGSRCRRTGGRRARDSRPVREAWNKRMLGFQGPAQPSPAFGRCPQRRSRHMRCRECSRLQGRPYKRSHLVAFISLKSGHSGGLLERLFVGQKFGSPRHKLALLYP